MLPMSQATYFFIVLEPRKHSTADLSRLKDNANSPIQC